MHIISPAQVRVTFKLAEVQDLSLALLQTLEDAGVDHERGAAAASLCLGRLLAPKVLSDDDEVQLVQALMGFMGAFFAEGVPN